MARQVYYDPFGARAEGFQQGMRDEQNLQANIRQARGQDWDYRNVKPLELQDLQRQTAYNQFADPYARRALGTNEQMGLANLYATQAPLYGLAGDITGNYNPAVNISQQYLGIPQMQGTPEQMQSARERLNRDFLFQLGTQQQNYGLATAQENRLGTAQQFEMNNFGQITPRDIYQGYLYGQQPQAAAGATYNPNDWGAYGIQPVQGQPQLPQAPAYQFPGFGIPGYDPTGQNPNPANTPIPGLGAPMPQPAGMMVPGSVGNPFPPGYQPATGPNAVNIYPQYPDGTPVAYGTPEWYAAMQGQQPQGEQVPMDEQGRPTEAIGF